MPNKIAEAQFFHIAEQEGLLTLTLSLNGDPVDAEVLDNFAYEVQARFKKKSRAQNSLPRHAAGVGPGKGQPEKCAPRSSDGCSCSHCACPK
jgi:hypothetical protein